ncbi:DNA mismatch repair protein MutS [Sphingomonas baiyangensis]|uniref:DNA mismatch repair protein MutS n=2 Tax=Sphingomonas baiyangensis TaxID=2572576 RepID=A0A4U1L787_9SPHN|nr:DNA mismatch repair protein MutS [Sphingomonas baiyangensis]
MASARPLARSPAAAPPPAQVPNKPAGRIAVPVSPSPPVVRPATFSVGRAAHLSTLDGGWDRRLSRGLAAPDSTIDLHGHSLASAHALLDRGLDQALARGDRVLLLVTGRPPKPGVERPYARGAIRAAVGDWLAGSRHADRIAAVRGAHPRHGGSGALYIVLRRKRNSAPAG